MFLRKKDKTEKTDEELVLLYKQDQNRGIIEILFSRYSHLLLGVGMKYMKDEEEARDVVMEVFEKMLNELHKHDVKYFKSWLYAVTRNECLMKLRSVEYRMKSRGQSGVNEVEGEDMEIGPSPHLSTEIEFDDSVLESSLEGLETCIEQLKAEQKECVELFFLQEKSYKEVSDYTGYSLNEVKSFLQNGKRNLKICMEKRND